MVLASDVEGRGGDGQVRAGLGADPGGFGEGVRAAGYQGEAVARGREAARDGMTDAAAGAGDQDCV